MSILTGDETYIGDGVYASYDGYQIKLRCAAPSEPNVIYLDPNTFAGLVHFEAKLVKELTDGDAKIL